MALARDWDAAFLLRELPREHADAILSELHDGVDDIEQLLGYVITSYSIHYTKLYEAGRQHRARPAPDRGDREEVNVHEYQAKLWWICDSTGAA